MAVSAVFVAALDASAACPAYLGASVWEVDYSYGCDDYCFFGGVSVFACAVVAWYGDGG